MNIEEIVAIIEKKYGNLRHLLNERQRRLWAGTEADVLGAKGAQIVAKATGLALNTVKRGISELKQAPESVDGSRIRSEGGGRKPKTEEDPELLKVLESLVDPATRGDPESPLKWTSKSTIHLADALTKLGHQVSVSTVGRLLRKLEYRLKSNRKRLEGSNHPGRNAQFEHINERVKEFQSEGQPVISVDAKKKELVGEFKNGGREWEPKGTPTDVNVHDFIDDERGKAIPYGVYDVTANEAWVSVGVDHDTAMFAVATIGRWWEKLGQQRYPEARELLITADCGGSNGYRTRLWASCLQELADSTGLRISVCHLPPGTSKWNKIEHRLFSFISLNWRGRPLTEIEVIISLIASTRTENGLRVAASLDARSYPTGCKITDEQLKAICIMRDDFHGEWNYTIAPRNSHV